MKGVSSLLDITRKGIKAFVHGFEAWSVILIILLMMVLPILEMASRWILHRGIPGSLLYTQVLTLWVGFLGALLAAASGKHLRLATGEMIANAHFHRWSAIYAGALSTGVCLLFAYASIEIVRMDMDLGRALPGGLPEWWGEAIMPVAMGLTALRFAWRTSDTWWPRILALLGGLCIALLGLVVQDPGQLLWPGVVVFLIGILLGTPVFVVMAGLAMLLFYVDGTPIGAVPSETYRLVASSTLPAIPLLTAAGYVLAEGGASKRLLRLAHALLGWAPGAMAIVIVMVLAAFTTFTGGSGVTILAVGGLALPMLLSEKYPEGFSLGLVTSAGSLGLLFPPSLPVILYAVVAGASIEELYIAGFLPGLLLVLVVALFGLGVGLYCKTPRIPFRAKEIVLSLWETKWELSIPIIVVAAIFTGFATMVEAAALALLAAILSQSFVFKELHWREKLPETLSRGGALVGAVIILLGVAMGLTSYLVDAEIPAALMTWTKAHVHSRLVFLLGLNAALLLLGSVLEIYASIIILAPLLAPMAAAYGIDPLHLGIIFLANLELGFLFPPMGLNLILSSTRFGQPLARLYRVTLPFLLLRAAIVLLITYLPSLSSGMVKRFKPAPKAPVVNVNADGTR